MNNMLGDPTRLAMVLNGLGMLGAKKQSRADYYRDNLFGTLQKRAEEREKRERQNQYRQQLSDLIGQRPGPHEYDMFPGETPIPGLMDKGSGFLGGEMAYPELAAEVSRVPGFEPTGLKMLADVIQTGMENDPNAINEQGMNIHYAINPETKKVQAYRTKKGGGIEWVDLGGSEPAIPGSWLDLGNRMQFGNRFGGLGAQEQPGVTGSGAPAATTPAATLEKGLAPAQQPENVTNRKTAELTAADQVQGVIDLPKAEQNADTMLTLLNDIKTDPNAEFATGATNILYQGAKLWPGSDSAGYEKKLKQIQGKSFLQAFESLKGAGQITEIEGKKATEAFARIDAAQKYEDFVTAVDDAISEVEALVMIARQKAGKTRRKWGE